MPEDKKAPSVTPQTLKIQLSCGRESVCVYCGIHYEKVINDLYMLSQVNKAIQNCLCVHNVKQYI